MNRVFIVFLSLLIACGPSEEEIQAQIDEAVEEALQEVSSTTTSTTTTSTSTSTTSTSTSTTTTSTSTSTTSTSTSTTSTSTSTTSTTTTTIYVDNEPPTWPDKTVTIVNLNPTYFEVQWKPASDNTNVAGYRFYLDNIFKGEYIRNNDNNSIFLDGLTGGTTYTLEIIAYDDETNQSIDNPTLTITTTTPTTTTTQPDDYFINEIITPAGFLDCSGNGCTLVVTCSNGNHTARDNNGWERLAGISETENKWSVVSLTLFQKGENSGSPLESGLLVEFNSLSTEVYNQYTESEWGSIHIELNCQP